jgi:hypothetical protein
LTGLNGIRVLLILGLLILVVEAYFFDQRNDRYSVPAPDTASEGVAPLEDTMLDGTAPEGTTAERGIPSEAADTVADRGVVASQRVEAEYVEAIEDIQTNAVETFLESHEKLLRYDSLSAADVEEMKANEAALQGMAERVTNLDPSRKYGGQHDVFASAIDQLHEAARLAHVMAADPVAAAETGFDDYDSHVNEASALLRRSNELLGENYESIEGVRQVSPEL